MNSVESRRSIYDGGRNPRRFSTAAIAMGAKGLKPMSGKTSLPNSRRIEVMPPLWCMWDRQWLRHPGILPGSLTRQPFLCPLDHVFEVNTILQQLPEEEFGAHIDIREYSFLENPSLPNQMKESRLDVHLCQQGSKGCEVSNRTSETGILKFPKQSSEETFKVVFSSFKDVKVIQFSSMQDAFLGFTDKTRDEKFRKRVNRYTGVWCCLLDHQPGYIYYDIYWDEKPGWKLPPQTRTEDDQ